MNTDRGNAILTFDYEVFLGNKTGTVENCVLTPTKSILRILEEHDAKAIFFVDALWLLFLKKNFYDDFLKIVDQLKRIDSSGSSIELHIHPQWLNAMYSDGIISFNSLENYKLQSLGNDEILNIFKEAIDLLQSITNQRIRCFRAGGWCIEPFSKIQGAFKAFNIKYDFSVVSGVYLDDGKVYDYDFTKVPKLLYYRFQNSVNEQVMNGDYFEVPLSTYHNNPVCIVLNKALLLLTRDKIYGDGVGIKNNTITKTIRRILSFSKSMLSLDKTSNFIFKYLIKYKFGGSPLIVIVSHPKTISIEGLRNLTLIAKEYNTFNSSDLDKYLSNIQ